MKRCVRCESEILGTGKSYCSDYCRIKAGEDAARERRERARRERRKASGKVCVVCGATLSMYGHGSTCAVHVNQNALTQLLRKVKALT
jgi:hypothetical protein